MTPEARQDAAAPVRRHPWLTLVVAALCTVPYAVGLVLPYYANGLHDRPAGTTLYLYDLTTLWPYDTALGGVVAFVAVMGMPVAPFVATGVVMWSGFTLWDARRTLSPAETGTYVLALLVAVGSIAWLVTPLSSELIVWFLD